MTAYYRGRPFIVYADKDALDGKEGFGYLLDTSFDKVFDFIIDKAIPYPFLDHTIEGTEFECIRKPNKHDVPTLIRYQVNAMESKREWHFSFGRLQYFVTLQAEDNRLICREKMKRDDWASWGKESVFCIPEAAALAAGLIEPVHVLADEEGKEVAM